MLSQVKFITQSTNEKGKDFCMFALISIMMQMMRDGVIEKQTWRDSMELIMPGFHDHVLTHKETFPPFIVAMFDEQADAEPTTATYMYFISTVFKARGCVRQFRCQNSV